MALICHLYFLLEVKKLDNISIDIETYSSVNLQKAGVYKYAKSDDFEILLFAYSADGSMDNHGRLPYSAS